MRLIKLLSYSITVAGVILQIGCGSNSQNQIASSGLTANWNKIVETISCEAMNPIYCKGNYSFTISNNGQYTVGPGPLGQIITATLTSDEFALISADATAVATTLPSSLSNPANCQNIGGIPGSNDEVDLALSNQNNVVVYLQSLQLCIRGDQGAATKLHTDLNNLLIKYYPTPFPASGSSSQSQITSSGLTANHTDLNNLLIKYYPISFSSSGLDSGSQIASSALTANWNKIAETISCEAMNPIYCKGNYSFTIDNNGRYTVGPGPLGQIITATLTSDEFALISADATAVATTLPTFLSNPANCQNIGGIPGSNDEVNLTLSNQIDVVVYLQSLQLCIRGDQSAATKLHTDLNNLLIKYYPTPFPSN